MEYARWKSLCSAESPGCCKVCLLAPEPARLAKLPVTDEWFLIVWGLWRRITFFFLTDCKQKGESYKVLPDQAGLSSIQLWISTPAKSWVSEERSLGREWGFFIERSTPLTRVWSWFLIGPEGLRQVSAVDTGEKEQQRHHFPWVFGFHYGQELGSSPVEIFKTLFFKEYSLYLRRLGKAVLLAKGRMIATDRVTLEGRDLQGSPSLTLMDSSTHTLVGRKQSVVNWMTFSPDGC